MIENNDSLQGFLASQDGSLAIPFDLTQPFTVEFDPLNSAHFRLGKFQFLDYNNSTSTYSEYATGNLLLSRLEVTTISTVPLPAGLPLLAFALGGLAILAQRRRARASLH